jgi:hypothetical protein
MNGGNTMAKGALGNIWKPEKYKKKTSIGKTKTSIKLSSMNKDKKRSYKPSRGQGKAT